MRRFILAQVFILQTSTVFSATYPIEGVWQGKLGTLDIVACFNDERSGSYYYTHQKKPIQLSREEQGSLWSEEGKTGSWKLDIPK